MGIKWAVRFSRTFWTHFAENEGNVVMALNGLATNTFRGEAIGQCGAI